MKRTSGMELNKLHVLVWKPGTRNHGSTVASARVRTGAGEVRATVSSRCKDGVLRSEAVNTSILHTHGHDTWRGESFRNMESCVTLKNRCFQFPYLAL